MLCRDCTELVHVFFPRLSQKYGWGDDYSPNDERIHVYWGFIFGCFKCWHSMDFHIWFLKTYEIDTHFIDFKFSFLITYICGGGVKWIYASEYRSHRGQTRTLDPLRLELQAVGSCLLLVLETLVWFFN